MILKNKKVALNISNIVTINQCANVVLAAGASPVMSTSWTDIKDLLKISSSLTVNIGTANQKQSQLIIKAVEAAIALKIPIILDPVGSGASYFRTNLARKIATMGVSIIKGNTSEILSLDFDVKTKGVDNLCFEDKTSDFKVIAHKFNTILLITGEKDLIINNNKVVEVKSGNENMMLKTGMGCLLASLIGALVTEFPLFNAVILGSKIMKDMGNTLFKKQLPSYNDIYNFIINYE